MQNILNIIYSIVVKCYILNNEKSKKIAQFLDMWNIREIFYQIGKRNFHCENIALLSLLIKLVQQSM